MSIVDMAGALGALVMVVLLIVGFSYLVKRFGVIPGVGTAGGRTSPNGRMEVVDTLALDPRRRLLIVRMDDHEHLILLGQNSETVVYRDGEGATFAQFLGDNESKET